MLRLLPLVPVEIGVFILEYLSLPLSHLVENDLQSLRIDDSTFVEISIYSES